MAFLDRYKPAPSQGNGVNDAPDVQAGIDAAPATNAGVPKGGFLDRYKPAVNPKKGGIESGAPVQTGIDSVAGSKVEQAKAATRPEGSSGAVGGLVDFGRGLVSGGIEIPGMVGESEIGRASCRERV